MLAHSSVSSIPYVKKIEEQNNNLSWVDQINEFNKYQGFSLSYADSKVGEVNTHNKATIPSNISNPHGEDVNNCSINMCISQKLETSSIPYENKQPAELNS